MSDITVVTAYFDIGRGNWPKVVRGREMPFYAHRTEDTYFDYFTRLASLQNDMIIATEEKNAERILKIRREQSDGKTDVLVIDFQKQIENIKPRIETVINRPEYIKFVNNPHFPEYWNTDYILINLFKTNFVVDAFKRGLIKNSLAAWIDFGYVRDDKTLKPNILWKHSFDPSKMHYFNLAPIDQTRPIFDIIKTGDVYIMGCHIVGGEEAWHNNLQLNNLSLQSLLHCGLMDDDQTFLLMNYLARPDLIDLHYINEKENGWFVIFNNFNDGE